MDEQQRMYHEVANIFPLMQGEEFEALKTDIAENGLREAIWLHPDGRIIDGRNRHRACIELDVDPVFRTWDGNGSLVAFVVSLNLHRRHLTAEQRVAIAQDILPMLEEESRLRQGARTDLLPSGENLFGETSSKNLEKVDHGSVEEAGRIVGISHAYVSEGKRIKDQAPEVLEMMRAGGVNVPAAKKLAQMTPEERAVVLQSLKDEGIDRITTKVLNEKEILEAAKQIRAEKTEQRRAERKARNEQLCQEPPNLEGLSHKFDLIYADPPWRYEFSMTDSREIENQYPTMALDDICAMPVEDIAIDNAVLFLWTTLPKLEEALRVVNAWGFSYRTAIAWDKVRMGQGIYTRQQVELLLICIKGEMYSPETDFSKDFRSIVRIERSNKHSEKPEEFYDIIEGLYPDCTRIELFARHNGREGWIAWGNQTADNGAGQMLAISGQLL